MSSMSSAPPTRDALVQALEHALRQATAQGTLYGQVVAQRLGLTGTDLDCLDLIHLRGPVTAGELARATGLTTGAVTGLIDRLERAGFAERARDPADRRKVLVRALPEAAARVMPMFAPMQAAMRPVLARYTDAELALLLDYFTRSYRAAVDATTALTAGDMGS